MTGRVPAPRSSGRSRPEDRPTPTGRPGRRLGFGLLTLLGLAPRGFFIPYRHAGACRPAGYPALEPLFRAAEPGFRAFSARLESYAGDLLRILGGPGPARFDQDWFPRLDAAAAYLVVRHGRPRRIVEIGSGHSTRFLARAAADEGVRTAITAIDPAPRTSLAGLDVEHRAEFLGESAGPLIEELVAGDVLFVDSSHVAMPGSDLDRIAGDLLPRLKPGVLLHLHDILLPDPYPAEWAWRGYNESIVAAALIASGGFDLVFSSHWVATRHPGWLAAGVVGRLPLMPGARDTSLWLRKR